MKTLYIFISALALVGCSKNEPQRTAYTPPPAIQNGLPKSEFDADRVKALEELKRSSTDPKERAIAEMLVISQLSLPGGNGKPEEIRARLEALIKEHEGTWISAHSRIGLMETYNPMEQFKKRIDIINALLSDPGLSKLGDTSDPYLKPFIQGAEAEHISGHPRDFALFILAYNHVTAADLESAESASNQISSDYWKGRISNHLDQLRKLPQDARERRLEHFMKNQKQ